jgi:hypothetical protein
MVNRLAYTWAAGREIEGEARVARKAPVPRDRPATTAADGEGVRAHREEIGNGDGELHAGERGSAGGAGHAHRKGQPGAEPSEQRVSPYCRASLPERAAKINLSGRGRPA